MATFDVDVQGVTYEVDAPDEKTAWKWANATHAKEAKPQGEAPLTPAESIARNPVTRFVLGAAAPALGVTQMLARNPISKALGQDKYIDELIGSLESLKGKDFDLAGLLGSIAAPLGVASKLPQAATLPGKIAQGVGVGGTYGGMMPTSGEDFGTNKALQVGTGAAIGGAVPPAIASVVAPVKAVRNIVDPWLPGGIERVAGRQANLAAGDRREAVLKALDEARQIVPGSLPTAGEAAVPAGSTELAGLQKLVSSVKPSEYRDLSRAQDAARLASVKTVGQTPEALATAEGQRAAAAIKNYGDAYTQIVRGDADLLKLAENPYFKDALPDAAKIAQAKGINPKDNLVEFLHGVKISLDKAMTRTGDTALSNTERKQVYQVKQELSKWLEKKSPSYEQARKKFAEQSVPINQMQVGQYLQGKLQPALSDLGATPSQRSAMYAEALRDAPGTIKRSTGFNRFDDLGQVLNPQQVGAVRGVGEDLARKAEFESMATAGQSAALKQLGAIQPLQLPNALHRPIMITNAILNRVQGRVEGATLDELAKAMQNPQALAKIMRAAKPLERMQVMQVAKYFKNLQHLPAITAGASQ